MLLQRGVTGSPVAKTAVNLFGSNYNLQLKELVARATAGSNSGMLGETAFLATTTAASG